MTQKAAFVNELVTEPFNDFNNGVKRIKIIIKKKKTQSTETLYHHFQSFDFVLLTSFFRDCHSEQRGSLHHLL